MSWGLANVESYGTSHINVDLACTLGPGTHKLPTFQEFTLNPRAHQLPLLGRLNRIAPSCDPSWELHNGLIVDIMIDDNGEFIVSDDVFLVYGTGQTQFGAIQDYVVSLVEYYRLVESSLDDPFDQAEFQRLQIYLTHTI